MKTPGLIVATMLVLLPTAALAASAFDGTWKFNAASEEASKKPYTFVVTSTTFTCSSCTPAYTVRPDGTDQKVTGHDYDTAAVTLQSNAAILVQKLKGKTLSSFTYTVADDGKSATLAGETFYGAAPVSFRVMMARVGPSQAGSHPLSGSWVDTKVDSVSDSGAVETLGMTDDGFTLSANGQSYDAKFDGKKYAVANDPTNTMVKLKKVSPTEVVESDYGKGKLVERVQFSVDADGKHIHVVDSDLLSGRVSRYTLDKQP